MIQKFQATLGVVAVSMVGVALGCGAPPTEDLVEAQGAMTTQNGLAANGLAANGLAANGLAANGLAANGLAANGLAANGLADPNAQKFMEYVVSCALPAGRTVTYTRDGASFTFAGSIGVAPQWEHNRCDQSCQRWVSACVLARLNKLGVHRQISIRGDNDALDVSASELKDFSFREATYYGNLFQPTQARYACLPTGATQITRVCGDSLVGCAVTVPGNCKKVCDKSGAFGTSRDCASHTLTGRDDRRDDDIYEETVTVFLTP
jgi:GLTT repeat (6 copies)